VKVVDDEGRDVVLVTAAVAAALARILSPALARSLRNGEVVPADVVGVIRAMERLGRSLAVEATAAELVAEVPDLGSSASGSGVDPDERIVASMSTTATATALGCTDRYVRDLIAGGQLEAFKVGAAWRVTEASIAELLVQRNTQMEVSA
jgi:excisionase family DNA binding protein